MQRRSCDHCAQWEPLPFSLTSLVWEGSRSLNGYSTEPKSALVVSFNNSNFKQLKYSHYISTEERVIDISKYPETHLEITSNALITHHCCLRFHQSKLKVLQQPQHPLLTTAAASTHPANCHTIDVRRQEIPRGPVTIICLMPPSSSQRHPSGLWQTDRPQKCTPVLPFSAGRPCHGQVLAGTSFFGALSTSKYIWLSKHLQMMQ
ncbi:uncharacterized protein LOC130367346 [Hyla sarda]|uniref:uncharacterized protein LOC130367346 n=1 Tax=Hyla sarda TaxID=327740 RepID=UPI0024C31D66|nr:uncharacterized protein LOC130367346 [Hyla sarda]